MRISILGLGALGRVSLQASHRPNTKFTSTFVENEGHMRCSRDLPLMGSR